MLEEIKRLFAELHGGGLSIESALGRGTTVTVVLPMAVERPAPLLAAM